MSESVDSVIEEFPYSTVEKHIRKPNYQVIKEVECKIMKNTSLYSSELSRGNHGYLELILKYSKYNLVTVENFIPHPNLRSLPTFLSNPT